MKKFILLFLATSASVYSSRKPLSEKAIFWKNTMTSGAFIPQINVQKGSTENLLIVYEIYTKPNGYDDYCTKYMEKSKYLIDYGENEQTILTYIFNAHKALNQGNWADFDKQSNELHTFLRKK